MLEFLKNRISESGAINQGSCVFADDLPDSLDAGAPRKVSPAGEMADRAEIVEADDDKPVLGLSKINSIGNCRPGTETIDTAIRNMNEAERIASVIGGLRKIEFAEDVLR
jgi:hypothetical protein